MTVNLFHRPKSLCSSNKPVLITNRFQDTLFTVTHHNIKRQYFFALFWRHESKKLQSAERPDILISTKCYIYSLFLSARSLLFIACRFWYELLFYYSSFCFVLFLLVLRKISERKRIFFKVKQIIKTSDNELALDWNRRETLIENKNIF